MVAACNIELGERIKDGKPGDRVDVVVTGDISGSHELQTRTILTTLRLLEIGLRAVVLASQEGRIKLVLRNPEDSGREAATPITRGILFGETALPESKAKPAHAAPAEVPKFTDIKV